MHVRSAGHGTWQTFLALLGTRSSRGEFPSVSAGRAELTGELKWVCSHVPHSSTDCILLLLGAGKIQREHSSEIGETTNICRHSGEGFFPALPIFSSIRAVLKSAVQRQKASAAQLWWDHPEGQKTPLLQRGCETFLGLEADTFILMLATPTVFPKISAKIWIN